MNFNFKRLLLSSSLFAGLFIFGSFCNAEIIKDFHSDINIQKDNSVKIAETIIYDFEDVQKHGIYRDIPIKYGRNGFNYFLRISDISVKDENENSYNFSTRDVGNDLDIKIGDADTLISGVKTYSISYTAKKAINYFDNYDEFYWNINGFDWTVDIERLSATITIPEESDISQYEFKCFYGVYGETDNCEASVSGLNQIIFSSNNLLKAGENLTVLIKIPKGVVTEPSTEEKALDFFNDNLIFIVLPILTFLLSLFLWNIYGKAPKGRGTIIAEYDAPDHLTPIEVGTLNDERTDDVDISAKIIYLAINGYLKITKIDKKGFLGQEDYRLDKLKEKDGLVNDFDKKLMDYLFEKKSEVLISEFQYKNIIDLNEIRGATDTKLKSKLYFKDNLPAVIRFLATIEIFVLVFLLLFRTPQALVAVMISEVIIIIFAFFFSKKTEKGSEAKEHIEGLKLYLSVAEKRRIEFHNAPKKNPQTFEKLLPYAMALGVEKEWAKQFEGIYTNKNNNWYYSSNAAVFSSIAFTNDLKSFSSSVNASFYSTAGAGGSGFGGGGFSGGGFGGGGGGSW